MRINVRQKQKYYISYTHVTQREAVACFDREKYCQIGHTSTCHPKFDMCMGTRQWSHIHTLDRPGQRGYKMAISSSVHLESCLRSFHFTVCFDQLRELAM